MGPTNWRPLQAGDTAYTPVTDHPSFPLEFKEGAPYLFRDPETAERIASAWNSLGGEWTWYVKEFLLLPAKPEKPKLQLSLF